MKSEKSHHNNAIPKHKVQKSHPEREKSTLNRDILKEATACNAKPSKSSSQSGGIRIVNSKNGKRLEFSKRILSALNNPKEIKFLFKNQYLILDATDEQGFPLKGQQRNIVYSAALVVEITERFSLDFSDRTCASFPEFKGIDNDSATTNTFISCPA